MVRNGLFALAGQRSLKTFSGLVFYHCVREGVQGDGGPREEGELILIFFYLGTLKHFLLFLNLLSSDW